jgi:hypothetical protein
MDVLGFGERGEGAGRRVRVRAERGDDVLYKPWISRTDRTLSPTPLPGGEGLLALGNQIVAFRISHT